MRRVALVPGVLALLPEYAGLVDPVAELRAACLAAVAWLAGAGPVQVVGSAQGVRVGCSLLAAAGVPAGPAAGHDGGAAAYLVVGNGSARRSEKAPGHLDERAVRFDEQVGVALRRSRFDADLTLAGELLADVAGITRLADLAGGAGPAVVDYDDDPYGVQYWVMRWTVP